jgi:hypothetical protein
MRALLGAQQKILLVTRLCRRQSGRDPSFEGRFGREARRDRGRLNASAGSNAWQVVFRSNETDSSYFCQERALCRRQIRS